MPTLFLDVYAGYVPTLFLDAYAGHVPICFLDVYVGYVPTCLFRQVCWVCAQTFLGGWAWHIPSAFTPSFRMF